MCHIAFLESLLPHTRNPHPRARAQHGGSGSHLDLLVGLLAHHDGVLEAEVEDHLGVDHPVARLVEGVLDVGVQEVERLPRAIF